LNNSTAPEQSRAVLLYPKIGKEPADMLSSAVKILAGVLLCVLLVLMIIIGIAKIYLIVKDIKEDIELEQRIRGKKTK
jgi:hypothetical protein